MKISWNYLQSFFKETLNQELVLERLTMAGLEVESETPLAPEFSGIVVGEVIECERHPDADKLSLCKVAVGSGEPLQIICGAANVAVGVKIPCAKVGAVLPGNFKIAERKMRGIVSYGMLCSGDELGCPNDVDGLLLLPSDAPLGMNIREYLDLNDTIVEFKITPNRGDCLSYTGLAREVAALAGFELKTQLQPENYLTKLATTYKLTVQNPAECPHYVGLVMSKIDNARQSPAWLVKILERSGVRAISPLVDIANFVMLNLGQPMHAFDLSQLADGINVRRARNDEKLLLIDGKDVVLSDNSLLIANGNNHAVAIAGVMGGSESAVNVTTTEILLESAYFSPDIIHGKAKQYGVSSDAAFRYERGVDSQIQHDAINLAAKLIQEICGGVAGEYIHFSSNEVGCERSPIKLSFSEVDNFIGEKISHNQIIKILTDLGCVVEFDNNGIVVVPPSYRFDLNIKPDIIEEIIRVFGYDKVEAKMPNVAYTLPALDSRLAKLHALKHALVGYGFNEAINYAFVNARHVEACGINNSATIKLQNPIAGWDSMRTSLLPGLIKCLQNNINRGHESVKLFELARVFLGEESLSQPLFLAGLIYGKISSLNWCEKSRDVDFYDLRQVAEVVLAPYGKVNFEVLSDNAMLHPGRSASILLNEKKIGTIGQLHPRVSQSLDLAISPYVFELNTELVNGLDLVILNPVSKFQKVSRDLAFVFDKKVAIGDILQHIKIQQIPELLEMRVFDVFTGGNLAASEKSVAFNFIFQANKTLAEDEINAILSLIQQLISDRFAAKLR